MGLYDKKKKRNQTAKFVRSFIERTFSKELKDLSFLVHNKQIEVLNFRSNAIIQFSKAIYLLILILYNKCESVA